MDLDRAGGKHGPSLVWTKKRRDFSRSSSGFKKRREIARRRALRSGRERRQMELRVERQGFERVLLEDLADALVHFLPGWVDLEALARRTLRLRRRPKLDVDRAFHRFEDHAKRDLVRRDAQRVRALLPL